MQKVKTKAAPSQPRGMSNRVREREALLQQQAEAVRKIQQAQRRQFWLAGLIVGIAAFVAAAILVCHRREPSASKAVGTASSQMPVVPALPSAPNSPAPAVVPPSTNPLYPSLTQLAAMTPEELAKVDIAVVNLRCAEGLPGAEKIDIAATLQKIDEWTARVKEQTDAYAENLSRHPERYGGMAGKYQMDMLTTVLQQDFGLRYDPAMIAIQGKEGTPEDTFYQDARHVFLNGLTEQQVGTCSSMPVLYAAIALRLGYPVRLANAAEHLYLQWMNEDGSHFNIEATAKGGLMEETDEYYRQWPHPVTPAQAEKFHYFEPLNARDELAMFLSMRATVLMTGGNMFGAVRCQMEAQKAAEGTKAEMSAMLTMFQRHMYERQVEQARALLDQRDRQEAAFQSAWPPMMTGTPKP